jgi:hypothetical protein
VARRADRIEAARGQTGQNASAPARVAVFRRHVRRKPRRHVAHRLGLNASWRGANASWRGANASWRGAIDIVARRRDQFVFIKVKTPEQFDHER